MFERGGGSKKGGWSGGPPTGENKSEFQYNQCLKWPILTEITAKYGTYFYLLYQQGGGGYPPLGAELGTKPPPPPRRKPCVFVSYMKFKAKCLTSLRIYVGYVILTLSGYFIIYFKQYSCSET